MSNKLVIIGGSGSITDEKNKIGYEKIYPTLISNKIKELKLYNLSKPGNDVSETLIDLEDNLIDIKPSHAIIDLGLVDCSPRVFSRRELAFLLSLPESVQKLTYGIQKKHRRTATKIRRKVYVPIDDFQFKYRQIIEKCMLSCDHIFVLLIARPTDYVCNKSYKMESNIIEYNTIIKKLASEYDCDLIDVFSATKNSALLLANDGYHLSESGHYFIYNEFKHLLNK